MQGGLYYATEHPETQVINCVPQALEQGPAPHKGAAPVRRSEWPLNTLEKPTLGLAGVRERLAEAAASELGPDGRVGEDADPGDETHRHERQALWWEFPRVPSCRPPDHPLKCHEAHCSDQVRLREMQ